MSQEVYRAAFGFLTDEGRAQKAITANQTPRQVLRRVGERLATWPGFTELLLFPLLVTVAFSYAAASFRLRARNRGKHHVREVFDALLGAPPSARDAAGGESKDPPSATEGKE